MKNLYLIDNSNRIKPQHFSKSTLHLNKNVRGCWVMHLLGKYVKLLIDKIIGIFQVF